MNIIDVTPENLEYEHICCAISNKKEDPCVSSKKMWMKARFEEGLVFKKLDARGKVFIEYIPAEKAWCPIKADGFMHINCFWVSGSFKGQGYANDLLEECIKDAKTKEKCGLTVLSSKKKLPYLSDPKYLKYKGFSIADTISPNYELLYLPFEKDAKVPMFNPCAKAGTIDLPGMVLYYSNQCPHTVKYAGIIEEIAQQHGQTLTLCKIETTEQAQNAPMPFTTYGFFYDGKFITNEILSEKKFEAFLAEKGM